MTPRDRFQSIQVLNKLNTTSLTYKWSNTTPRETTVETFLELEIACLKYQLPMTNFRTQNDREFYIAQYVMND